MNIIYKLIDKNTTDCIVFETTSLEHACYKYMCLIENEMKILQKYNFKVNKLNFNNLCIVKMSNSSLLFNMVLSIIKFNIDTMKFVDENNNIYREIMYKEPISRLLNIINDLVLQIVIKNIAINVLFLF